jgi:hypothetical protein
VLRKVIAFSVIFPSTLVTVSGSLFQTRLNFASNFSPSRDVTISFAGYFFPR